jgi:hypothetical protein
MNGQLSKSWVTSQQLPTNGTDRSLATCREFDFWFDGGAAKIQTGYVEYSFTTGAHATVGAPIPALSVIIDFPNACRVRVQQERWGSE